MDPARWIFDGWGRVVRVAACAPVVCVLAVAAIRGSGKRSTSQTNTFDCIVTVAMGSIVGSAVVLEDVAVVTVLVAVVLLLGLQRAVTSSAARWEWARWSVQATPTVLSYQGAFQDAALRAERVTRREVMAAVRETGLPNAEAAGAVVLETDASLSVISASEECGAFGCLERGGGLPDRSWRPGPDG